jgi:hypothetical protein
VPISLFLFRKVPHLQSALQIAHGLRRTASRSCGSLGRGQLDFGATVCGSGNDVTVTKVVALQSHTPFDRGRARQVDVKAQRRGVADESRRWSRVDDSGDILSVLRAGQTRPQRL